MAILFTISFGFWNLGVAKKGDGVKADGILGSSSCIRNVRGLGGLAKRTLFCGVIGAGVFLFRASDRLKIGVVDDVNELLVGMAGVLVPAGPPRTGPVPGSWLRLITSLGDCACDVLPCLLYTSPSPRDGLLSRMPSSA